MKATFPLLLTTLSAPRPRCSGAKLRDTNHVSQVEKHCYHFHPSKFETVGAFMYQGQACTA